jgi:hypothetical protein
MEELPEDAEPESTDPESLDAIIQSLSNKQSAFLKAYLNCSSISSAAEAVGCRRTCHYVWIKESPGYAKAFEIAQPIAVQNLEDEAIKRATLGWDEPVFYQGVQCGTVKKFSDSLLALLLKGHKPMKYRDRTDTTISNPDGSPLAIQISYVGGKTKDVEPTKED